MQGGGSIEWKESLDGLSRKYKIYCYAIKGYAQSVIAVVLHVTPAYVCKVIKELKKEGYLKEVFRKKTIKGDEVYEKTKPILYDKTDKIYPISDKLTSFTSGMQKQHLEEIENPRLNLICVQYEIIKPPVKEISGHAWINNNTTYLDYKENFECGQVTFRIINGRKLVLWFPERTIDKRHIRGCTNKIYNEVQIYANWFQKQFGCRLGLPEVYQDYHIAFKEDDPLLCDLVKKHGILKIVDVEGRVIAWWDKSKKYTEYETQDERIAEAKAFGPLKIVLLEDKIDKLESTLSEKVVSIFEEKVVPILDNKLSSIIEEQLSKFFDNPKPPDGFEDVT